MNPVPDQRETLGKIFTVVIELDNDLRILSLSPIVRHYAPDVQIGQPLDQAFELIRPAGLNADRLSNKQKLIFLMVSRDSRYPIRGQVIDSPLPDSSYVVLGSPWLSRLIEDGIHSYQLSDFPPHDAQLDWLFMLSAEQQQVSDLKRLSADLEWARTEAEEAIASKSAFFTVMSHEMRTPLNAIIGAIQLISSEAHSEEDSNLLKIAGKACDQLLTVINDVLDYSKMEAGRMELEHTHFRLVDLVDDVTSIAFPHAHSKNLSLDTVHNCTHDQLVEGDDGKIKQILLNLVSNAVKFTETGGVTLEVAELERNEIQSLVRISVSDTGVGIAEADKAQLFQEFWTSPGSANYHGSGTGLGLDISKRMTKLIGGSIDFESEKGVGSCFWIDLPLTLTGKSSVTTPREALSEQGAEESLRGKRILVAEDNQANQLILKLMLERLGLIVNIASNGLEAVEALRQHPYDAVLMDIGMPEMSGEEATHIIRTELALPELPIIACTAHPPSSLPSGTTKAGFSDYISKPIDKNALVHTLLANLTTVPAPGGVAAPAIDSGTGESRPGLALIDWQLIDNLRDDIGDDNFPMAVEAFVGEITERCEAIRGARQQANLGSLEMEAHAIKGCALSYGAVALAEIAQRLESGAADSKDSAWSLVEPALSLAHDTLEALRHHPV